MARLISMLKLLGWLPLVLLFGPAPATAQPRQTQACAMEAMPRLPAEIRPRGGRQGLVWQPTYYRCQEGRWVRIRGGWRGADAPVDAMAAVEMRAGRLTLRPGFRFVQEQPGGPVAIARINAGPRGSGLGAVTGTFDCRCRCRILGSLCSNTGCTTQISGSSIDCVRGGGGTCNGTCGMSATTSGLSVIGASGREDELPPCEGQPALVAVTSTTSGND